MMNISTRQKRYFLSCCLFVISCNSTFSFGYSTSQFWQYVKTGKPVVAIGAGAAITSDLGESQNFPFNQPVIDTSFKYSPNNATRVEPIFDVFVGGEWVIAPQWTMQFGLGYDQTVPFEVNGVFNQGVLPLVSQINNDYRYDISVRQVLLEGKWQYVYKNYYRPYFFLGLGAAINTASNYVAYVPFPNLTRQYKNNTETSFSYALGFGIDVDLLQQVRLGIGYRFSDFGAAELGQANILGNSVAGTLSQNNLYASEVLTQLTFIFD